jgi:AbiV family abortive infection protein
MKPMSLEQLIEGRLKCLQNAADLVHDAEILLCSGRSARAVHLAYIAIEELGKYLMITGGIGRILKGTMDWKRFWKRFRSHKEKAANIMAFDAMLEPFVSLDDTLASLKRSRKHTDTQETEKLSSLYVDVSDGAFVAPMDHVAEHEARNALESAGAAYRFLREMETRVFAEMSPHNLTPEAFARAESLLRGLSG